MDYTIIYLNPHRINFQRLAYNTIAHKDCTFLFIDIGRKVILIRQQMKGHPRSKNSMVKNIWHHSNQNIITIILHRNRRTNHLLLSQIWAVSPLMITFLKIIIHNISRLTSLTEFPKIGAPHDVLPLLIIPTSLSTNKSYYYFLHHCHLHSSPLFDHTILTSILLFTSNNIRISLP